MLLQIGRLLLLLYSSYHSLLKLVPTSKPTESSEVKKLVIAILAVVEVDDIGMYIIRLYILRND